MTSSQRYSRLVAVPGQIGDDGAVTLDYGTTQLMARMGKKATPTTLKRFLVGLEDKEITGLAKTPDGKAIFSSSMLSTRARRLTSPSSPIRP